jgi:hypothetical protein
VSNGPIYGQINYSPDYTAAKAAPLGGYADGRVTYTEAQVPSPPCRAAIDGIDRELEALGAALSAHRSRIDLALRHDKDGSDSSRPSDPSESELHSYLIGIREKIAAYRMQLQYMTGQVTL